MEQEQKQNQVKYATGASEPSETSVTFCRETTLFKRKENTLSSLQSHTSNHNQEWEQLWGRQLDSLLDPTSVCGATIHIQSLILLESTEMRGKTRTLNTSKVSHIFTRPPPQQFEYPANPYIVPSIATVGIPLIAIGKLYA